MKTILLPFYDDDAAEAALDVSRQLAACFGSFIEGLFVMRPPQIIDGEGIVLADSYLTQLKEEGRRLGDRARVRFDECVARHGITVGSLTTSPEGTVAGWREMEGLEGQVIGDHGRLFDLIVIGSRVRTPVGGLARDGGGGAVRERAPDHPGSGGGRVKGLGRTSSSPGTAASETARTVALAMPLLAGAEAVTVVSVEGWGIPGPTGEQLCGHLLRNGISATACTVDSAGRPPGEAVLDECTARSARTCWSRAPIPRAGCGSSSSEARRARS